ncbi:hypothetical protein HHK36_031768 [Tetracentron sinense]|uniref:DUF6598 domain-containing protein n=1 Tax=Tetracentron sinense TaxID=13715 RepID=A0A835CXS1_TETSI|nr:hypothetical protein HHK36_031768 [Tetracentron sinense]
MQALIFSSSLKPDLSYDMSKIEYIGGINYVFGIGRKNKSGSYKGYEEKPPDYVQDPLKRVPRIMRSNGTFFRPLVEVFSVQIMNLNRRCNIFGEIKVVEGIKIQYLYNRKREESESIDPDNPLLLIGPVQTISGFGNFGIYVDLMVKDKDKDLPLVSRGLMSWDFYESYRMVYDRPTPYEVDGDYGDDYDSCPVRVNYAVLNNGVEATLTFTLIIGDGEDPSHVYGRITACNSKFSEGSLLFRQNRMST